MTVLYKDIVLADKVTISDSFLMRFKGLMGTSALAKGQGILLNTSSIHCFFMQFPIDAIYISKDLSVLGKETLKPWRVGKWFRGTKYILELNAGSAASVSVGDPITLDY